MDIVLAAALMFALWNAAASLLLLLPVLVATESLYNASASLARRFWLLVNAAPPVLGFIATLLGFLFYAYKGPLADPHNPEIRLRAHFCLLSWTVAPDAAFRIRLLAWGALMFLLFALVRLGWKLWATRRAQALATQWREIAAQEGGEWIEQTPILILPRQEPECFVLGSRPAVIIATEGLRQLLDKKEWQAIIAHELAHVAHKDLAAQIFLQALTDPFLWLPSTHFYLRMARRAMEYACDEAAAKYACKESLLSALQKMEALKKANQEKRQGELASLRPTFPRYAHPQERAMALRQEAFSSFALPLPVILALEAALFIAAIGWLAAPLHDTLYCAAKSLLTVLGAAK